MYAQLLTPMTPCRFGEVICREVYQTNASPAANSAKCPPSDIAVTPLTPDHYVALLQSCWWRNWRWRQNWGRCAGGAVCIPPSHSRGGCLLRRDAARANKGRVGSIVGRHAATSTRQQAIARVPPAVWLCIETGSGSDGAVTQCSTALGPPCEGRVLQLFTGSPRWPTHSDARYTLSHHCQRAARKAGGGRISEAGRTPGCQVHACILHVGSRSAAARLPTTRATHHK